MFRTKRVFGILLCGLGLMAAGCAHRAPALAPNAAPKVGSAVLYGRFVTVDDNMFHNQLALWLRNPDTRENTYIYFDQQQQVTAMEVRAGRYRIVGFVGVNRAHHVEGRREFLVNGRPPGFCQPFEVGTNMAVYLGDFRGHASFDGFMAEWKVETITNNYAATTHEMRESYPQLKTFPAVSITELLGESREMQRHLHNTWEN